MKFCNVQRCVMFQPHMTSAAVSPPHFTAAKKGKGTTWKQDLINVVETDIVDMTLEDNEELEIVQLVSLWNNQTDSDTVNNHIGHEDVVGQLVMGSRHQEFWE